MLTEKQRRFAEAYIRLANKTHAAIEAGYSARSAAVQGCILVKNPKVVAYLESKRVDKSVHADVTYKNLVALGNIAIEELSTARRNGTLPEDKVKLMEVARRCLETVGKVEGLFIERHQINGEIKFSLQQIAQKAGEYRVKSVPLAALPLTPSRTVEDVFKTHDPLPQLGAAGAAEAATSAPPPPALGEAKSA